MSGVFGANPDELEQLGSTMQRQREAIDSVIATVGGALSGTTWMGPARDRFQGDWDSAFVAALRRLNEAFDAAGQDCRRRAAELRRVMGAG